MQRGHLYGYDNSYIIDSAKKFRGRLLPVVILDPQDVETPARFTDMVKHHGVRGFRMANTRPAHLDTAWMSSPAALQVWKTCADLNVPMALIFFYNQWGSPSCRSRRRPTSASTRPSASSKTRPTCTSSSLS